MNTPYVTTKDLAELLPFSLRHLSERVTHRRDFPAARRIGKRPLSGDLSTDFVENSHSHHGVSSSLADCLMAFGTVFKNRPMPSDRAALTRAITAA